MANLNVLVVGASIAGPMTAYWLAKAGARVTVIERFPELRKGGQNIDIRTVGVTVMRKIPGMEDAVRARSAGLDAMQLVTDQGQPIFTMEATGDADQQSLVSEFEIYRGDLSKILYDLTVQSPNIKYVFGEQIASMQSKGDDEPITVEFANGHPTETYDLVVAADGATSRTRAIGLGCGIRDYVKPINVACAYFSIDDDILNGSKVAQGVSAVGGRSLYVAGDPYAKGDRCTLMSCYPNKDDHALAAFREAQRQGTDAVKQYFARRYEGVGWKTPEVLQRMMGSEDFYASEMLQVFPPQLSKGRFVMVGDAGYATGPTGTGTSAAMCGAYLLAGELCKHSGDVAAGLQAYEERMKPIIVDMQKIPPFFPGVMSPQTEFGIWFRNTIISWVTWAMQFGRYFTWVTALFAAGFGGDKHNLPDYEWAR